MRYYPVQLDIKGRKCLVVGGGAVATRKVGTLLKCGAEIKIVSPELTEALEVLCKNGPVEIKKREYVPEDLEGCFLVIAATSSPAVNQSVGRDAESRNMLCNIADFPQACNFILPSVINRGDLTLTISTSGKSPAFAKKLRKDLACHFGEEYAVFLTLMGAVRKKLLQADHAHEAHKHLFEALISGGLLDLVRDNKTEEINALLYDTLGSGFSYNELMGVDKSGSN